MLHKLKSTYGEIAKYFPELSNRLSSSAHKKSILLDMAGRGEPKPNYEHPLRLPLYKYTSSKSNIYDQTFSKEMRKLRPDWFIPSSSKKKHILLKMARNGEPRPQKNTKMAICLTSYLRKDRGTYDPAFSKEINKIAPHWFISQNNNAKQLLLKMARKGKPRPTRTKHHLARPLTNYTTKTSRSYDAQFTSKIKNIAPGWFINRSEKHRQNKIIILEIAKSKGDKPKKTKHPLGRILLEYTYKKSKIYDPVFAKQIKKLAPHWFKFKRCSTK